MENILTKKEIENIRNTTITTITTFLQLFPDDKDSLTFKKSLEKII